MNCSYIVKCKIVWNKKINNFYGAGKMYKAVLVLYFVVITLIAVIFSGLKDNFYTFL